MTNHKSNVVFNLTFFGVTTLAQTARLAPPKTQVKTAFSYLNNSLFFTPPAVSLLCPPANKKAPAVARATGVRSRGGSPLRKPQLPESRPQAPHRLAVGLLVHLLGFELSLQLLHLRAVLPLSAASAAVQLDSSGELVSAFTSRGQQVAQIPPQMGEPQGVVQLLLLSAQLIEQQLHLNEPVGEMADGDRGEALVIGAEGGTGSGRWGDAQGGKQCQSLGTTRGWFAGARHRFR
jgi:hypothetical protein